MKLIIEIDEELYEEVKGYHELTECELAIFNGTPIPDNATECDIDAIRAEIDGIEINGQIDEHTSFIRTGEQVKKMALEIISKFTKGE